MPILVTGSTGHIGNSLCRALIRQRRSVRAMIRPTSNRQALQGLGVETVKANLLSPESLTRAMEGCDVVYHAAGVNETWTANPELDIIQPAVEGTRNILTAAQAANVKKVIYVSSVVAMGGGETYEHHRGTNDWSTNAALPYNIAKTRSELIAHQLSEELDLPVIFVLPGLILGRNDYKLTPSMTLISTFLKGRFPFYFDGAFTVVHVEDVVQGMLKAEMHGTRSTRYVLGGDQVTVQELFGQLAAMTKREGPGIKLGKSSGKALAYPMKWFGQALHT
ncbi:MAG: NAD-dependent epimerase/dehydratase family protein, partial [Calditrichota bacterium]